MQRPFLSMGLSRQPLFAAALWLALVTAALSALLPAGLPRTTSIGSAFSPATTIETLNRESSPLRQAMRRTSPDGDPAPTLRDRPQQQRSWMPASMLALPPVAGKTAPAVHAPDHVPATPLDLSGARSARGPPFA